MRVDDGDVEGWVAWDGLLLAGVGIPYASCIVVGTACLLPVKFVVVSVSMLSRSPCTCSSGVCSSKERSEISVPSRFIGKRMVARAGLVL